MSPLCEKRGWAAQHSVAAEVLGRTRAPAVMEAAAAGAGGSPGLIFEPLFECFLPDLTALSQ